MRMLTQQSADAVQARLNVLLDRQAEYVADLASYRLDRALFVKRTEIGATSDAERVAAILDLQKLDSYAEATGAKLAETRRNIAELRGPVAGTIQPPSVTRMFGLTEAEFIGGGTFLLLLPMAFAMARNVWLRAGRGARPREGVGDDRLARIEQAVESVAIEVERIGESQRYASRMLAEKQSDSVTAVRPESAPRPVITPRP